MRSASAGQNGSVAISARVTQRICGCSSATGTEPAFGVQAMSVRRIVFSG